MQSNQQVLIEFFKSLSVEEICHRFFDDLEKPEFLREKEDSLLAIKAICESSYAGEFMAEVLIQRDYYTLWNTVEFDGERTLFIQARDLNAAYQLGFMICSRSSFIEGGFIYSKELHDNTYSYHPFHYMIEEKKAKELGLEKSPDGYYYQLGCLLSFWLSK